MTETVCDIIYVGSSDSDMGSDTSNIPDGHDLMVYFKGSFAYSAPLLETPNPCLEIQGVGPIGLPLSERDAMAIVGHSSQAPYGHGERTIVNTEVRDTWEISPQGVKFDNPNWDGFVQKLATNTICPELGAAHDSSPPRIEFYKLLLYQTGSHFLAHRDTPKADGMFATMIILLPSRYTGGEVHLTHAGEKKVFDFSVSSYFGSAVLAWYTDVIHEVKPITSGYRLALSYNIIHTSTQISRPVVAEMDGTPVTLKNILRKWKHDMYQNLPDKEYVVYVLKHKYCQNELERGISCLKGEDAYKLHGVISIARDMGFSVYMAHLKYHITGSEEDVSEWQELGYDESDYSSVETSLEISYVTDLDGSCINNVQNLEISWDCLVPESPFTNTDPDEVENEGYLGNASGTVSQWYRRAVLILVRSDDDGSFLASVGGINYAINKMQSISPSLMDKSRVTFFLAYCLTSNDNTTIKAIINLTIAWKDIQLWRRVISRIDVKVYSIGDRILSQAWKQFGFENHKRHHPAQLPLRSEAEIFHNLLDKVQINWSEQVQECRKELSRLVIKQYKGDHVMDVLALISIAENAGFSSLKEIAVIEHGEASFSFLVQLAHDLIKREKVLKRQENNWRPSREFGQPSSEYAEKYSDFEVNFSHFSRKGNTILT
ncbi:hypothetical protein AMATHDRAFT_43930 [Amanita thiersii Skay4041]|uniref:Fe2OG dioxygenase domain-containing protein n=1 Tax=Amanita thiersii Skay4041 TaxID=703135 RepID=A0A2A9NDP4_9AGAR|nr:hypothetical protein AMATHDRAFT_43930 [Amanita thiersii Skay4041]